MQDPELQRLIGKHRDDEIRHEALFRAQYARNSQSELRVPPELRLIDKLDRELGSVLSREVVDDQGVLEAYSLLQVLEERAVVSLSPVEPAGRMGPSIDRQRRGSHSGACPSIRPGAASRSSCSSPR